MRLHYARRVFSLCLMLLMPAALPEFAAAQEISRVKLYTIPAK